MSPKLPVVSGQQAVRVFRRLGYEVVRRRLIRDAQIDVDEFIRLLDG